MNTPPRHLPWAEDTLGQHVVSYEDIASRARQLWAAQGCPENCDKAIWLEAEAELIAIQEKRYRHPHLEFTT